MPKRFQKSVHDYLAKLKLPSSTQSVQPNNTPTTKATSGWILSGCKHPKTPSFAINHNRTPKEEPPRRDDAAATLNDIDRFLIENFSSLYKDNNKDVEEGDKKKENVENPTGFLYDSPKFIGPPPEILASKRFFISAGSSSSLLEEARESRSSSFNDLGASSTSSNVINDSSMRSSNEVKGLALPEESIAVLTYSKDPYDDFRQSMEEMIEVRLKQNQQVDWEFMEELLFCYLKLNEKKSHKYILGAFVDLINCLRQSSSGRSPAKGEKKSVRRRRRKESFVM